MKTIKLALVTFVALSILPHSKAWSAEKEGNGGGAYICSGSKQSEFLDLYEARRSTATRPALNIPTSSAPVEDQIQDAFNKLKSNPLLYKVILQEYQIVRSAPATPPPAGQNLAWPSDETNRYVEAGCQAVGIVIFHHYPISMDLDTANLESLPPTDQAAAWVHETIYRYLRITQPEENQNSVNTRAIVGYLFSDENGNPLNADLLSLHFSISPQNEGLEMLSGHQVALYTPDTIPLYPYSPNCWNNPEECWTVFQISYKIAESLGNPKSCQSSAEIAGNTTVNLEARIPNNDYRISKIAETFSSSSPDWSQLMNNMDRGCLLTFAITDKFGNTVLFDNMGRMLLSLNLIELRYPGQPGRQ